MVRVKSALAVRRSLLRSACIGAAFALGTACGGGTTTDGSSLGEIGQDLATLDCGVDAVPVMTGASTPSGVVTSSGEFDGSFSAFQAFDANPDSMWISETFETPAILAYQFADGPHTITSYAIRFVNGQLTTRAPRDWTLEGFDGSSWVVLDTRAGETGWMGVERRSYDVAHPGAYQQYRLRITDDNDPRAGVVVVSMGDLQLMECGCAERNLVPVMTGPTAPSGSVTTSGEFSASFRAFQAFDANPNSMWISETFETPAIIAYQFADKPHTVTSYAIRFVNGTLTSRAPRDWTLEGFNGSSWAIVDTRLGQTGWAGVERRAYTVSNPGSYQQYRLRVTDDNDSRSGVVVVSMGQLELIGSTCE